MPVQVNEIVIRAVVEGREPQRQEGGQPQDREQIVSECVEQVLEILKNQQER
jgi:hypothetical protein